MARDRWMNREVPRKLGPVETPWLSGGDAHGARPEHAGRGWSAREAARVCGRTSEKQQWRQGGASERRKKGVWEKNPETLPLVGL